MASTESLPSKPFSLGKGTLTATDIGTTYRDEGNATANNEHQLFIHSEATAPSSQEQSHIPGYNPDQMSARTLLTSAEEKKLLRRIDLRLMALCSLIFMFKNLDAIMRITSNEYNLVTVLYYIPYIRLSPSKRQSRIMVSWGIFLMCNAAVKNKGGLYATRFLLGAAEAGLFPGVILQMTYWYRPDEMSLRLLYFYICGNVSNIFGGLLAYASDTVSGAGGLSGWQWLFLTEGIATVIFGIAIWFLLPDFPATATWLTDREKAFIQGRLPQNAPRASEQNFKLSEIIDSLKELRLWLFTLIWVTFTVGTHGVAFSQSIVIADLGYTYVKLPLVIHELPTTQHPITVTGLLFIAVTGITADRRRIPRPLYPLSFLVVIIACYGVFVAYPFTGAIYALTLIGNALTAGWFPTLARPNTSRATGSAFSIDFVNSNGQIGGAIGPQIFREEYAPRYTVPFSVAMGLVGACAVLALITWWVTYETEPDTRILKRKGLRQRRRAKLCWRMWW
ncbi:major facilitator superfamily domain-containing protein [Aspergillus foveolatus]|uniref:major facilitator superfamily domain-containing protein n=1 Tax=Aspergillus foveolatus TaxID=210207 RepID=UPI003CCD75AB